MTMKRKMMKGEGVKDIDAVAVEPREFVNLTYDPGFKIVFGTEGKSERLLMTLLNRVLDMRIVSVKYLPTERLGLTEEESRSFFDVYCKDSSGRRFLIEMHTILPCRSRIRLVWRRSLRRSVAGYGITISHRSIR